MGYCGHRAILWAGGILWAQGDNVGRADIIVVRGDTVGMADIVGRGIL